MPLDTIPFPSTCAAITTKALFPKRLPLPPASTPPTYCLVHLDFAGEPIPAGTDHGMARLSFCKHAHAVW